MSEKILNLLGLMRKADAIRTGETNTGSVVHAGKAKLILLAENASENAGKKAESFMTGRNVQLIKLPYTKETLSANLGAAGCSMAAVTDIGFANALMKALAEQWPEEYGQAAEQTKERYAKAQRRKQESAAHKKNKRYGIRRTDI